MIAHQFPSIKIGGHARVIVGSAHGLNRGFASEPSSFLRWPTQFGARLTDSSRTTDGAISMGSLLNLATFIVKDLSELGPLIHAPVSDEFTDWWSRDFTVRQTIFRSCLQNVLSTCTERVTACEMLQSERHAMWTNSAFLIKAQERFGNHESSIRHVLELIDRDIGTIGSRLQSLDTVPRKDQHEEVYQQLTRLQTHINDFRDLVRPDFAAEYRTPSADAPSRIKDKVGEFRTVQKAAGDLYRSFLLACEQHPQHRVWLRIGANKCQAQNIEFNLVLDRILAGKGTINAHQKSKLCLVVKSALNSSLLSPSTFPTASEYVCTVESSEGRALQGGLRQPDDNRARKRRKLNIAQDSVKKEIPEPKTRNFCEKGDMCTHISKNNPEKCTEGLLLGILSPMKSSHHAIYASNKVALEQKCCLNDRLQYIAQVLSSTDEKAAMMRHAKIRLAKQLSITVLQYNATPWLQQSWDSNHILVEKESPQQSDDENLSTIADIEDSRNMSYLDVTIQKSSEVATGHPSDTPHTMIRNITLFRLGVMLLELAYGRAFSSMLIPEDAFVHTDASVSTENTDYRAADRLQRGVARKLGPVYARLVRQCIDCDFGHGQDLIKIELQEGFYEHVVDKLEVLEAKFKDLGI